MICYTVVGPIAAVVCFRFKEVRGLIVAGYVCFLIFAICMATATLKSRNAIWGFQILLGTGLSLVLNALVTAAQLSAPPQLMWVVPKCFLPVGSDCSFQCYSLGSDGSGEVARRDNCSCVMWAQPSIASIDACRLTTNSETDSAIFHSRISHLLPQKVAAAALSIGLPKASLPAFISALVNNETDTLAKIPGVTPEIITAGGLALKEAYLESFKSVWVAVSCFCAIGVIGRISSRHLLQGFVLKFMKGSFFFINPAKDLNNQIDAPAESEKDLYG
jgi:hypothetical protein